MMGMKNGLLLCLSFQELVGFAAYREEEPPAATGGSGTNQDA